MSLAKRFQQLHLRIQIILLMLLASTVSFVVVGFIFYSYTVHRYREQFREHALITTKVIADAMVSPLAFMNPEDANQLLKQFEWVPDLELITVFTREGEIFTTSHPHAKQHIPEIWFNRDWYTTDSFYALQEVTYKGERFGWVLTRSSLRSLKEIQRRYFITFAFLTGFVSLFSLITAYLLSPIITRPIKKLARTADYIRRTHDYGTRVESVPPPEVNLLIDSWNDMLQAIQERQDRLQAYANALRRSEQKFRTLTEYSEDAIIVVKKNNIVYVNPKFEKIWGVSLPAIREHGMNLSSLIIDEQKERFFMLWSDVENGIISDEPIELSFKTARGEIRSFDIRFSAIEWEGEPAVMGVLRDITERKNWEKQIIEQQQKLQAYAHELELRNKELDEFAYIVSHDLKAPLRAISHLVTWIEEDQENRFSKESLEYFDLLKKRVVRMENLIQGILEYSRVGRIKTQIRKVSVNAMLKNILQDIYIPEGFQIIIETEMPEFMTEAVRLEQVFRNLIDNSLKHHDKSQGTIRIGCRDQGDTWLFYVKDDGPGIPEQYYERIFRMFHTLMPRDEKEAAGVGLAIVKKIVEDQKCRIWIESEPGKGSIFWFTWPKHTGEREHGPSRKYSQEKISSPPH